MSILNIVNTLTIHFGGLYPLPLNYPSSLGVFRTYFACRKSTRVLIFIAKKESTKKVSFLKFFVDKSTPLCYNLIRKAKGGNTYEI